MEKQDLNPNLQKSESKNENNPKKGFVWYAVDIAIMILLIVGLVFIRAEGYFNPIYLSVHSCDDSLISVMKINEMEWNDMKKQIEQRNINIKQGNMQIKQEFNDSLDKIYNLEGD